MIIDDTNWTLIIIVGARLIMIGGKSSIKALYVLSSTLSLI